MAKRKTGKTKEAGKPPAYAVERRVAPVDIDSFMENVWNGIKDSIWSPSSEELEGKPGRRAPALDVMEQETKYTVVAELPGIPKKRINVEVTPTTLEISGDHTLECDEGSADLSYICNERTQTNYYRKVNFNQQILPGHVKSSHKDGVLTVVLPKKLKGTSQKKRKVKVK